MNEQKLTDWFPPEVLPARPGPYIREWADPGLQEAADHFDGKHWFNGGYDPETEERSFSSMVCPNKRRWRGLAEPPLTDWFSQDTTPVYEGVYEIESGSSRRWFAYWMPKNGWGYTYSDDAVPVQMAIDLAAGAKGTFGLSARSRRWRGLAVQP